jgi:hypothetical protein
MSNLQETSGFQTTVVVNACRFDKPLFLFHTGRPEMVRRVYIDLIKQR